MLQLISRLTRALGIEVRRCRAFPPDFDDRTIATIEDVQNLTMTSPERISAVCEAIRYIVRRQIPGAIVECGVWQGGSMRAAARTLLESGANDRDLFLFDTFTGLPEPGKQDVQYDGKSADVYYENAVRAADERLLCVCSPENVRDNMLATGYPADRIKLIPGRVEDTVPKDAPDKIAMLRLDTDWYESTKHELIHLFPRLVQGAVLIIDDYGHWKGARLAVDEYMDEYNVPLLLNRIDYSGRIGVITRQT